MRTVTIPNKQIELTEADVEQAVKDLARQKAEEHKTVPLLSNGACYIFPQDHPMRYTIQIRNGGPYAERGICLVTYSYDFALIHDEKDMLVLTVTKKAETR